MPLPGANEPFGGRIIRIGRILRGVGLGSIIIIAAEILSEQIRRRQVRAMDDILTEQDRQIAQAGIDRERERRAELEKVKEELGRPPFIFTPTPGTFDLPQVGTAFPPGDLPAPRPQKEPEIAPGAPEILPEIFPEIPRAPTPGPAPGPLPAQRPVFVPGPLTSPGQLPRFPVGVPSAPPVFFPVGLPVQFPFFDPVGTPFVDPIGDLLPKPLTPIGTSPLPFGQISIGPSPGPQPQQDTAERCQNVKRRRRRKGKCREGFFIERPGETQFITWREKECDSGLKETAIDVGEGVVRRITGT